jgi:hypothetical protein
LLTARASTTWRRVVENPDRFEADLYRTLGVTADEFTTLITKIKHYHDKFIAHLDEERTMLLPALEVARRAIVFLHEQLLFELPQAGGAKMRPDQIASGGRGHEGGRGPSESSGQRWRARPRPTYLRATKTARIGGMLGERTRRPPA